MDSILNIRALLRNVSLINEIYFVINPIWVKHGVIFAGAPTYLWELITPILLFRISTKNLMNIFLNQILGLRAIFFLFYIILRILHSSSVVGSPNWLPITYLSDVNMAINAVPV